MNGKVETSSDYRDATTSLRLTSTFTAQVTLDTRRERPEMAFLHGCKSMQRALAEVLYGELRDILLSLDIAASRGDLDTVRIIVGQLRAETEPV